MQSATNHAGFIKEDLGWTAGLDLNVQVVNSAKGTANANLGIPLLPDIATPSIVAVHSGIADRSVTLGLKQDLSKPVSINCASDSSQQRLMLSSTLGIKEWLLEVQDLLVEQRHVDKKFSPRTVGTTIKFTVSSNGSAGSSFSLFPIGRNNLGGGVPNFSGLIHCTNNNVGQSPFITLSQKFRTSEIVLSRTQMN